MCIYSSPLDQKGACCTSLTSLLMQCRAACQKRPSLRWNPRFAPAGQGCSFSARRVSCRRPYVEDPYWEGSETGFSWRCGFPRSCCFQGMKLKFLFITTFLEDPILRHPNARRSTEAKQHHSSQDLNQQPPAYKPKCLHHPDWGGLEGSCSITSKTAFKAKLTAILRTSTGVTGWHACKNKLSSAYTREPTLQHLKKPACFGSFPVTSFCPCCWIYVL